MPNLTQLFKPEDIRTAAAIDSNVYDEDIATSAKWVQDEHVERVLGTPLFNRLCELVDSGDIDQSKYASYKYILDNYLLYIVGWGVRAEAQPLLHNKVRNAGVTHSTDEHLQTVDQQTMYENIGRYMKRMNVYVSKLADYLRCHAGEFPEYSPCGSDGCGCEQKPQRNSGNICGIYLDDRP